MTVRLPIASFARHPQDGWELADPIAMSRPTLRAFHALVAALLPPAPAPRPAGMEERVLTHVRRMLQYMPPALAFGFILLVHVIDWSPLWRLEGLRPIHSLSPELGSAALERIAQSRLLPIRLMMLAPKACVLSTYFDQDEVHAALGYDPRGFFQERVERYEQLVAEEQRERALEVAQ